MTKKFYKSLLNYYIDNTTNNNLEKIEQAIKIIYEIGEAQAWFERALHEENQYRDGYYDINVMTAVCKQILLDCESEIESAYNLTNKVGEHNYYYEDDEYFMTDENEETDLTDEIKCIIQSSNIDKMKLSKKAQFVLNKLLIND